MTTTMHTRIATAAFALLLSLGGPAVAGAQTPFQSRSRLPALEVPAVFDAAARREPPASSTQTSADAGDLKIAIYPILLWVPAFTATTTVPAFPDEPNGPDLPGGSGSTSPSFDGAALFGFSLEKANWRIDTDGIWAALVTTRDRPLLEVDLDVIYGHVSGGVKVYKDLYVTGGVRRVALKYDIQLGDRARHFVRKPGLWDPLVGLAWHSTMGSRWVLHVAGEGGGFGAGADVDLSAGVRADLKIVKHFGLTLGYSVLYLKLSDTVANRTFEVKQTLHGPVAGLGFYF